MKKVKLVLMSLVMMVSLSACQLLTAPVDVAAGVIMASDNVDSMQADVGAYSTSQQALADLDALQADIKETLTTGDNALYAVSYQSRSLIIYTTLKREVNDRWGELSPEQQASMIALDNELIAINSAINSMRGSADFDLDIVDLVYRATILMTYYKGI